MSKRKSHILKTICFLLIFALLFCAVSSILEEKYVSFDSLGETYTTGQFNALEKNSIELAFLGSSQIIRGISCMRLLEEDGISAFSAATGTQPMMCSYYYAKRLLKTQHLRAAVLDVSSLFETLKESHFRRTADNAPWSPEKAELIINFTKYRARKEGITEAVRSFWSYLFPVMAFHDRWTDLGRDDFDLRKNASFIFRGNASRISRTLYDGFIIDDQPVDPDVRAKKYQLMYFRKIAELFRDAGIPLLLIKTPKLDWTHSKSAAVQALADEYGLDFLDFNTRNLFDAAGFDVQKDIADQEHLNYSGAFKLTDYLAEYLAARVDFDSASLTEADVRDLAAWHRMLRKNDMLLTEDAGVFLDCAQDEDCTMVVTADAGKEIPASVRHQLAEMGFHTDLFGVDSYIGIMSGGTVTFEKTAAGKLSYETILPNQQCLSVSFTESTPGWFPAQLTLQTPQGEETVLEYGGSGVRISVFADNYPDIHRETALSAGESGLELL